MFSTTGELLTSWKSKCKKGPVEVSSISHTDEGLDSLLEACAWEAAVQLSAELGYNDDMTLINRKYKQVLALMCLKRHEEALVSLGVILGCTTVAPNMEKYLMLHLFRVEIYIALGDEREAIMVIKELNRIRPSLADPMARLGIDMCDIKLLLTKGNIKCALERLLRLLDDDYKEPEAAPVRLIILCDVVKALLLVGGLGYTAPYLQMLRDVLASIEAGGHADGSKYRYMADMVHATVTFAHGDSAAAMTGYEACIARATGLVPLPTEAAGSSTIRVMGAHVSFSQHDARCLVMDAVNNLAVCALHSKDIKGAIDGLESLIQSDPPFYLQSTLIFNLCTMYELSSTPELSDNRKRTLHMLTKEYGVTNLEWSSFRITIS